MVEIAGASGVKVDDVLRAAIRPRELGKQFTCWN